MNIVLIGMRGTGKTTIAKILSTKLNRPYYETDQIIEERAGGKPVTIIVKESSWQGFRDMEKKIVEEVSKSTKNAIISAGGGVVLDKKNMENLKKNNDGIIIWLKANIDTIIAHIGTNYTRPKLTTAPTWVEELKLVYEKRKGLYEKYADFTINTDGRNPEQISEEIISKLKTTNYQLITKYMIDAHTKLCCVIGHPVTQSLSPLMHNAVYKKLGLNYVFLAFNVTSIPDFIDAMRILNIRGASVTIPHKIEVMKYLDKIDPIAKEIGAANTIVNDKGLLTGYNTDWIGALSALEEKVNLPGKKVAILGAGGAARAISYGLKKKNAHVSIFDRPKLIQFDKLAQSQFFDIIINATPVGMTPNDKESPIPKEIIEKRHVVFDIVFKPYKTRLLNDAEEKGATVVYGYKMLLYGASLQFKLFTGMDCPIDNMEKSVIKVLNLKS